jgi:hypothetical protein
MQLRLYTTAGCHLCELAHQALLSVKTISDFELATIEIGDNDGLIQLYGVRIPVLRFPDGEEMDWPFSSQDILYKINQLT